MFDPLQFLCRQAARDFNHILNFEGETGEKKQARDHSRIDPSSHLVIRRITAEGPKGSKVAIRYQGSLVHFIPEGEKYVSEGNLGIAIKRIAGLVVEYLGAEAGEIVIYMECDLYPVGSLA